MRGLSLRPIMPPCRLAAQMEGRARTEAEGMKGVEAGEHRALAKAAVGGPCPSCAASSVDTQRAGVIAGCHG